jgi:hypothetical protein
MRILQSGDHTVYGYFLLVGGGGVLYRGNSTGLKKTTFTVKHKLYSLMCLFYVAYVFYIPVLYAQDILCCTVLRQCIFTLTCSYF